MFQAGHDRWLVDLPGYGYAEGKPEDLAWVSSEKGLGVRELRAETAALLGG